ncbi:MAG: transcription antitermination factor NusB [Clostridiales bacterium]|nr:transcription antitermination factor NusB [Clostridiales bacterium]
MKKQTRSEAREAIFTQVFQFETQRENMEEAREALLNEIPECEQNLGYITEVTDGILEHEEELTEEISKHLKNGWTFKRLSKVARAILLLGVYEMKYCDDVPPKVAINEAVEIAKKYCDEKEPSFINGVLGSVMREL